MKDVTSPAGPYGWRRDDYDTLVIAGGSRHSYFGRDEWAQAAPGLKTVDDATEIRCRMLFGL